MSFSAFIVDDEAMARGNLIDALQQHGRWAQLETYPSGKNLVAQVVNRRPHAVFLDIQMPGDDGIALARKLLALRAAPLVVFVTAHSEYAVEAFELYAVDYLLKPFSDDRLAQCVAKLEQALDHRPAYERRQAAQAAWAQSKPLERLVIKSSTSVRVIDTAHIHWIAANGNYVDIHHDDGKHLLRASLKHVLSRLPPNAFIRIHRGYAVRCDLIREVKTQGTDRSVAVLASGEALPVGKSYRRTLMNRMCAEPGHW